MQSVCVSLLCLFFCFNGIFVVRRDLSFKKGDIVVLRKKIDNNWYVGECGTNHGVFPLSYVQVNTCITHGLHESYDRSSHKL